MVRTEHCQCSNRGSIPLEIASMQELYNKLISMRDRLEKLESVKEAKDHLEEIKHYIQFMDSNQVNSENEEYAVWIFEDALNDAENTLVRIG
jgi:hypothetical protein